MLYRHSGGAGDVVYSIPTVLALQGAHEPEGWATLLLQPGVVDGSHSPEHPSGRFRLSPAMAERLLPLLASQGFDAGLWEGEEVEVDLDLFRRAGFPLHCGHLPASYFYAFAVHYDLSLPWLAVEADERATGRVVVNRTGRYRNFALDYKILADMRPLFVGLDDEFQAFRQDCPTAELAYCEDFLQVATLLAGCRLFVGNQSACFAIAEGLKVPRILEVSPASPNVVPQGPDARAVFSQSAFKWALSEFH